MSRFFLAATAAAVLALGATPTQEANAEGDWRIRDDGAPWNCKFSCGSNGPSVFPWCACTVLPDIIVEG